MAGNLPRVLAGPIVRRVEPRRCSFWVALSEQATVKVRIWKGSGKNAPVPDSDTPVGEGQLATRRIGAALHVAVVTVDMTAAPQPLTPGETYSYDVGFTFAAGARSDLHGERLLVDEVAGTRLAGVDPAAPLHKALGFVANKLPSFLAPPSKFAPTSPASIAAGLRIAHCSCRRPGAGTFDAMAGLAPIVANPNERPHQLYLTGDQIYADDVAAPFLPLVTALGHDLLAGDQSLPGFPPDPRTGGSGATPVTGAGLPGNGANLPPLRRKWLLWQLAAFTGGDTENHLITFPEFVAHYLLAWSPRVWRALPQFAGVFRPSDASTQAPAAAIAPWLNRPWFCGDEVDATQTEATLRSRWASATLNAKAFQRFNRSVHHLARYAGTAPLAAQVLANTPTSMIFDDHEVADDWNLNGRWVTKVSSREWGRYVLRNGIMAYALMQGWGNDPKAFAADKPGGKLLDAIATAVAPGQAPTSARMAAVDVLAGIDAPTAAIPKRVDWSYAWSADGAADYRVAVLDTRTRRDVNNVSLRPPNLIVNLDEQLPARSASATEQLLVVVSAAPIVGPAVMEQLGQPLAQLSIDLTHAQHIGEVPGFGPGDVDDPVRRAGCGDRVSRGAEKFDLEGWSASESGLEALLTRVASYPSVVVLSGDVHYGATMTLDYWSKARPQPSRLVQCTSSPAKNVFKEEVEAVIRQVGNLQRAEEVPAERLAWDQISAADLVPAGARLSLARRSRLSKQPALVPSSAWPPGSRIPTAEQPDWRWRLQPVVDAITALPTALRPVMIAAGNDGVQSPATQLAAIAAAHQRRLAEGKPMLRRLVFAPNFGTVRFESNAGAIEVVHRLHSQVTLSAFAASESAPRPAGSPAVPAMGFGAHTVHRARLRPPANAQPPIIRVGA